MVTSALLRGMCVLSVYFLARLGVPGETLSLSLTNDKGGLVLSWPSWAADGVLEQSTNLPSFATWNAVSRDLYQTDSVAFHYRFSASEASRFYRLRRVGSIVAGQVGYWSMDEGNGQVAIDQAGSRTSLYTTNVGWAAGRIGPGSLWFNGEGPSAGASLAWVSNTNYRVLPSAGMPFSVSLWFSPASLSTGWQGIIGNDANGGEGWHLALNTTGPGTNYLVLAGAGNGSSLSLTGRTMLLPGQWHQLTVSYANNQGSLYLDSRLLAQGYGGLLNPESPFYLGGAVGGYAGFSGRLDELRVYTKALSQDQVCLTGEWHFDENAGSLAADSSIQGRLAAVVAPGAWTPGKTNSGIDLSIGPVVVPNADFSVLPPSGAPFSISLWVRTRALPVGRSGLMYCGDGAARGWQLTVDAQDSSQSWLEFTSTNLGGTLALRAPVALTNGAWTKLDLTYSGGIATLYVNGCEVQSGQGAIRAAPVPLMIGAVPGAAGFNGVVDELKIYNREREAAEIGPVALPVWETALVNSYRSFVLPGAGPPGKLLTYSLLSAPAPTLGKVTYSPGLPIVSYEAGGRKGPDSFAYTVSDGEFISPPATAAVSVVQPHWLAPEGGNSPPRDGSSPDRAWTAGSAAALDAIWMTNNYYDCFFYSAGEFQTRGWKFKERGSANPGCKHIGSGSEGPGATIIKLVDAWGAWSEGLIFGSTNQNAYCDDFEVRNLVLDCNAQNNPKYVWGEPVWILVPLTSTARVDTVTLYWTNSASAGGFYQIGGPAEFTLAARSFTTNGFVTNSVTRTSTSQVDVVTVGADTDQLLLVLNRRPAGVDFYGLAEMEVSGAAVSLPVATVPGGGPSLLDPDHSILRAVDDDRTTSWASGPESQVQITLPLASRTPVTQINFRWNCQTLTNLSRLGPAAGYLVYARDESTGEIRSVPFVSHGRGADGLEIATFGTGQATNVVSTDQLTILLAVREPGVDYYSLRELSLQNGRSTAPLRVPSALNALVPQALGSVVYAFDGDLNTAWVSGTQGSVTALDVAGSNLKFTGLKVINFGTKAGRECFPLSVLVLKPKTGSPPPLRNVLVEDCVLTQPATNNVDGLTAVTLAAPGSASPLNAVVRRCTVTGVKPYFGYSHAFTATWVENCRVEDCGAGVYFEPDPEGLDSLGPVLIRSNQFFNVVFGVTVDFHPGGHFDSLRCLDNEIVLADNASSQRYGIRVCDVCVAGPSGSITNLLALRNTVRYPEWTPRPVAADGGLLYGNIQHAVYGDNILVLDASAALRVRQYPAGVIPDKPPPEDCDHPGLVLPGQSTTPPSLDVLPPGYRRGWYNNRDLSGALLPVRYSEWGVDRPASEQQWPE